MRMLLALADVFLEIGELGRPALTLHVFREGVLWLEAPGDVGIVIAGIGKIDLDLSDRPS